MVSEVEAGVILMGETALTTQELHIPSRSQKTIWDSAPGGSRLTLLLFFHHNSYQLLLFWHIKLKRVEILFPANIIHQV